MSVVTASALRTLAFGDLDAGVWGTIWNWEGAAAAVFGVGAEIFTASAELEGVGEDQEWRVAGQGIELTLTPLGAGAAPASAGHDQAGFAQLCHVSGTLTVDGEQREVECVGSRSVRTDPLQLTRLDSAREVSAWFGSDEGVALLALRPRAAAGHEADLVTATVFEPTGPVPVADPRLSTTYTESGSPSRVSLELWIGEAESQQYLRRAAGESTDARGRAAGPGFELEAAPLRFHSAGNEGTGIYVLVRPS